MLVWQDESVRRFLTPLLLAVAGVADAEVLYFTPYVGRATAGQPVRVSVILDNPTARKQTFNTAVCPGVEVTSLWTKKVVARGLNCTEPLNNVEIPAHGRVLYTFNLPALPYGEHKARIKLNDSVNKHQAIFDLGVSVFSAPQIVQWLDLDAVYLSGQPITLKVVTQNVSSKVFSQDIRLCGTGFLIRDRTGETVYETPAVQTCTADISLTTLKPGEQHTEAWWRAIKLSAGKYQVLHWSSFGSAVGTFDVA